MIYISPTNRFFQETETLSRLQSEKKISEKPECAKYSHNSCFFSQAAALDYGIKNMQTRKYLLHLQLGEVVQRDESVMFLVNYQ